MRTVLCVLKSGGIYDAEWVRKLRDGVARNLSLEYRFACLSDVEVPCERIALQHDWPGWWSKLELFRPGVVTGPTLYLDLDTVITGPLGELFNTPHDFAMLRNFYDRKRVGSGVMWFKDAESVPAQVYTKFAKMPECYIQHHERTKNGAYIGDQAFISDALGGKVDVLTDHFRGIRGYKYHCTLGLPKDTSVVCFAGLPRPPDVKADWMMRNWI